MVPAVLVRSDMHCVGRVVVSVQTLEANARALIAPITRRKRVPGLPTSNPEQFYQGAPLMLVPDVSATADFYRRFLGFKTDTGTETPEYRVVWRDNAAVHLAQGEHAPTGVRIVFWVKDVDALHAELIRRGAAIAVPIGTRPYGVRDFSIRDLNGVDVVFGQDCD